MIDYSNLKTLVDLDVEGIDIMHGMLKVFIYEAEKQKGKYWEGYQDALVKVYGLTYDLSFAINEKKGK